MAKTIDDARISTGWLQHPKTIRLGRRLGPQGIVSLLSLILWTAANEPDGNLEGHDDEGIEIIAAWTGESGAFISAIKGVYLDGEQGTYSIHDWNEHQPWAAGRPKRSASARRANAVRWGRIEDADRMPDVSEPDTKPIRSESESNPPFPSLPSPNQNTTALDSLNTPQPVNQIPRGEWTDDDTGTLVCRKLKFSGTKHPRLVSSSCPYIRDRMGFKTNQQILDWLPDAWTRYSASDAQFKYGFEKWLTEGHYADDTGPPVKRLRPSEVIALQEKARSK